MFSDEPIPAIFSAINYLKETVDKSSENFYIVGYSKGGYLAITACLMASEYISDHILSLYNYDGPGISNVEGLEGMLEDTDFNYYKFIPQDSVVGRLFDKTKNYEIIESLAAGPYQHNPHTWKIAGNQFVRSPKTSVMSDWISNISNELIDAGEDSTAANTVDTLFMILKISGFTSFADFREIDVQKIRSLSEQKELVDQESIYTPLEIVKIFSNLLNDEVKTTASLKKRRIIKQIIAYKVMIANEIKIKKTDF